MSFELALYFRHFLKSIWHKITGPQARGKVTRAALQKKAGRGVASKLLVKEDRKKTKETKSIIAAVSKKRKKETMGVTGKNF